VTGPVPGRRTPFRIPAPGALPWPPSPRTNALMRRVLVGLIGFLTLVDLFAAQAILPTLARMYHVAPSAMVSR